jgi:hypothetical protein
MNKFKFTGLRTNENTIDAVTVNAEDKEQAEKMVTYLSWSWRELWRHVNPWTDTENKTLTSVDSDKFKLPEGYHIEISLVKDTK